MSVLRPDNASFVFDFANLNINDPKPVPQGGRCAYFDKEIFVQLSNLRTFGRSAWDSAGKNNRDHDFNPDPNQLRHNLAFIFDDVNNDPAVRRMFKFFYEFNEWVLDYMEKNFERKEWFGRKPPPREALRFNMKGGITSPDALQFADTSDFSPVLKCKVPVQDRLSTDPATGQQVKRREVTLRVFDRPDNEVPYDTIQPLQRVDAIVRAYGVWTVSGNFGVSWVVHQVLVHPKIDKAQFMIQPSIDFSSTGDGADCAGETCGVHTPDAPCPDEAASGDGNGGPDGEEIFHPGD